MRLYQVSVLVFSQPLMSTEDLSQQRLFAWPRETVEPKLLPESQSPLLDAYQRLRNSANYRPLLHQTWIQQTYANQINAPYQVSNHSNVEGIVRLQRGQYLSVIVDMQYHTPSGTHVLREKRQLLLNEVNYLDHPAFGVLIQVSPVALEGS